MLLDVRPILYEPGKQIGFRFEMDLSDEDYAGYQPIQNPVIVEGTVINRADVLHLSFHAESVLQLLCARCAKPFELEYAIDHECVLSDELQNEDQDDIELLENGQFDIEELARAEYLLGMETRYLCSEDCKGRCLRCGADLNLGPCGCRKEIDPRFAKLAALLDEQ